ncbi:MAG: response regulator [Halobacteriales archaeon]|nr:response regulator [Halobacteriales archaeon]
MRNGLFQRAEAHPMRFLVVDDDRTSRRLLSVALRQVEPAAEVDEASSLDEALASFEHAPPEVVFLDMMLDLTHGGQPGGSTGLVALSLMRDLRPDARVVLVTSLPRDDPDVLDALQLGAMEHLEKPYGVPAVRAALQSVRARSMAGKAAP